MVHLNDRFIGEKIDQFLIRLFKTFFMSQPIIEVETPKENQINVERTPLVVSFSNFLNKVTVVEPAYKEVVILYKNQTTSEVNIKYFHHVPLADLELIFPEVSISAKPLDILQITFTFLIALVTLILKLFDRGGSSATLISGFSFALAAIRVYLFLTKYQTEYNNLMIQMLSNKT